MGIIPDTYFGFVENIHSLARSTVDSAANPNEVMGQIAGVQRAGAKVSGGAAAFRSMKENAYMAWGVIEI